MLKAVDLNLNAIQGTFQLISCEMSAILSSAQTIIMQDSILHFVFARIYT